MNCKLAQQSSRRTIAHAAAHSRSTTDAAPASQHCCERKCWRVRRAQPHDLPSVSSLWHDALYRAGHAAAPVLAAAASADELRAAVQAQLERREAKRRDARALHQRALSALHRLEQQQQRSQQQPQELQPLLNAALDRMRLRARQRSLERAARAARRARCAATLVLTQAEPSPPGEAAAAVLGYASLSVAQPAALLPPPFPSAAPWCLCVDGLAVAPAARRGGGARALISAAADRGARLGARGLWLACRTGNYPALALYRSCGFRTVAVVGPPWRRENLMRLPLDGVRGAAGGRQQQQDKQQQQEAKQRRRVYVWTQDDG